MRVLKAGLSELGGQYDLVIASHSVEHTPDPREVLAGMCRRLRPGRYAVVRVPVVAQAWRRYRTDWVQLDAPRRLFLFTASTFASVAEAAGFVTDAVVYDSTAFQFWGSEQYARDIPLTDERSYHVNPANSLFTPEQIAAYEAEARELNARGEGDQAVFYLRKPSHG